MNKNVHAGIRVLASAVVLAGGMIMLTPRSAWACDPTPCCTCEQTSSGGWVCCCWNDDGSFNGCYPHNPD
jgi:hypothetical protein